MGEEKLYQGSRKIFKEYETFHKNYRIKKDEEKLFIGPKGPKKEPF